MMNKAKMSIFNRIEAMMVSKGGGDIIPLHIGDTYLPVASPAALEFYKPSHGHNYGIYAPTQGIETLRKKLAEKVVEQNHLKDVDPSWIQVTAGATHALWASLTAFLEREEKVLLTAPWWPIITNVCDAAKRNWIEAPLYLDACQGRAGAADLLGKRLSVDTKAIYLSSPNNPSGVCLDMDSMEEIAAFAVENDLLVISDEAYEDFIYTEKEHISIASLPGMIERTVTVFSFSKTCAASGYRLGYAVALPERIAEINALIAGSIYNAPTPAQYLILSALQSKETWFPAMKKSYSEAWKLITRELCVPVSNCEGGFFVFPYVGDRMLKEDVWDLVDRLLDEGVSVTPGIVSGPAFASHIRICFVAVTLDRLAEGIKRINRVLGG